MPHCRADQWIEALGLEPHPEGGHYRRVYTASLLLPGQVLAATHAGPRPVASAITYLLKREEFSALHRLASDEMWHLYDGGPLVVHVIEPEGQLRTLILSREPGGGGAPLAVVPAGCWFGAELDPSASFALVGCTVSPAFDFADFEMGSRAHLVARYPFHHKVIQRLTRP